MVCGWWLGKMDRIPVGSTIAGAYRFLVVRVAAVLGLGWLPAAFYAAAAWFCLQRMGAAMLIATPSSAGFNQFTAIDFAALLLATALLVPTVAVPFTQTALGVPRERVAAHFVFGGREWRMFLALLRYYAVVVVVLAALAFLCQIAIGIGLPAPGTWRAGFAMPANLYGAPISLWLNGAAAVLLAIAFLFLTARFGFFLPASAAAEDHVTLRRAWALSRRNFWRIAVVTLAVAVPPALLFAAGVYAIEGDGLGEALRNAWTGIPSEGVGALYRLQYAHAGALAGLGAVGLVVMNALFAGASAAAYRVVEAAANAPEVSRQRTEPDFEPAWAPAQAMVVAARRWHPDPYERPTAEEFAQFQEPSQIQAAAEQPVAQHEAAYTGEAPAEEPAHLAQPAPAEPAAEIAPLEPVAPPEEAAQPVATVQAAAPIMAPPLDPAGAVAAMAMRDQINPPPPAE